MDEKIEGIERGRALARAAGAFLLQRFGEHIKHDHECRKGRILHAEADPEWACESMDETVKQILDDAKKIKTMLLELRDRI